jgi:uncharacterized membrane protein YkoI
MNNKKFIIPALALSIIGGGIAGTALKDTASASSTTQNKAVTQEKEVSDASEQKTLKAQAKITEAEAVKIALAKVKGQNNGTELEDEDGEVVYGVEVKDDKNNISDVKVNALTGAIVKIDTNDQDKVESENSKDDKEVADDQKDGDKEIVDDQEKDIHKEVANDQEQDNDKEVADDQEQSNQH